MNTLIVNYNDDAFQTAFRAYGAEIGIHVTNWEGLFAEMNDAVEPTYIRRDEAGRVIGFIMFTPMEMKSWFFETKVGFIREFWVDPAYRSRGIGGELLAQVEAWLTARGIRRAVLTTDTAPKFYMRYGYRKDESILAKNNDPVFIKEW